MKLLLTSNGLSNQSIAKTLFEMVGKPASETTIVFIPTAMNVATGTKDWFIDDLWNIKKQNCAFIDIVDISALPNSVWQPRVEAADVLFFSGGSTTHLMRWLKESGLIDLLSGLLQTRVWAGISAGSMVTNPSLALSNTDKKIYYEETFGYASEEALNFVDFYIRPHYNSPSFPQANSGILQQVATESGKTVYGIDDQTAIKVVDGNVEVISEGTWKKFI